jgi:hypothetical protein
MRETAADFTPIIGVIPDRKDACKTPLVIQRMGGFVMHTMGVFIRSIRTRRYYAGHDHWVSESSDAFDFRSRQLAREWIGTVNLAHVEIVSDFVPSAPAMPAPVRSSALS